MVSGEGRRLMTTRLLVCTPAPYTGWMSTMMQAFTLHEKSKIKVAKWGTAKKYL
jgi:hypothetical protein